MAALNLTTLNLPHLPPNSHNVHIAVLKDICNAEHLRSQLLAGNADYEYAFIDASNVCVPLRPVSIICWPMCWRW